MSKGKINGMALCAGIGGIELGLSSALGGPLGTQSFLKWQQGRLPDSLGNSVDKKPEKKRLILSPSQAGTALDCRRKWWFERVARLPELPRVPDPRTLGDVLHEVCERFLAADELGRDLKTGEAVDLYPKERLTQGRVLPWTSVVSKFGHDKGVVRKVTEGEAALIQKLITAAIEQGVLVRSPTGRIEARFDIPLAKTPKGAITFMGFRDYLPSRDTIEDHKTMKFNRAPWRKTPKALHKDVQMRSYGYAMLWEARKRGEPPPEVITLTHNQFSKDPDDLAVRKTKTTITRDELDTWWTSTIEPLAHDLMKVREIKEWHKAPEPAEGSNTCNKYGGCAYLKICGGIVSMDRYTKRIQRLKQLPQAGGNCPTNLVVSPNSRGQASSRTGAVMGFAEKMKAKKAKQAALAAGKSTTPTPKAAAPAAPAPTAPASGTYEGDTPPWADSSCRACKGVGFNSKGSPCRICDTKAPKAGRPTSKAFELVAEDGVIVWSDGETEGSVSLVTEVTVDEAEETPEPEPEPPVEEDEKALLEVEFPEGSDQRTEPPVAAPEPAPKAKARGRGRPAKGFTLLIDCNVIKGTGKVGGGSGVLFLDATIARYGAALAKELKKDSFYSVNAFDRRDALCKVAEVMAHEFGTDYVCATTGDVEQRELLKALRPLASTVIVGSR